METDATSEILSSAPTGAEEGIVIKQSEWGAVRTLFTQGMSKIAIARQLDLSVKTVRKWLTGEWQPPHRGSPPRALDRFSAFLNNRAPEVGFNAVVLLRELRGLGYEGSYPALVRYIRPVRQAARQGIEPTRRFETEPGQQAQVDWGSTAVWCGPEPIRVHLFVMVLGYSRRLFAKAYLNERLDSLLDAHAAAFSHFGGRTREILYDNPRTIVLRKDEASGHVEWNRSFKDRMDFYGVEIRLCRFYRAQTKGKVESGVKYVKRNALAGRRFRDLDELNAWLLQWCVEVADERLHGTTHERPAARFARDEVGQLIEVDARRPPPRERLERRVVPADTYVSVETNRYPVPVAWVGHEVEVRILPDEIILWWGEAEPVSHARLSGKYGVARWPGVPRTFPRPLPAPPEGPPRFDPAYRSEYGEVELRPLTCYEALVEEVAR